MDKQTCAALLNMLGFDSYDMTYNEWLTSIDLQNKPKNNTFLLKSHSTNFAGSVVKDILLETTFKSYDTMIAFARQIHEKRTRHN